VGHRQGARGRAARARRRRDDFRRRGRRARDPHAHLLAEFARSHAARLRASAAGVLPRGIAATFRVAGGTLRAECPLPPIPTRPSTSATPPTSAAAATHIHAARPATLVERRRGRTTVGAFTGAGPASSDEASDAPSSAADAGRN